MIPKIIHYCWFGGKSLPAEVKKCIKSWEKWCPDYKIIRWDESNFDVECHPFVKTAYDLGAWAFVSDYARLKVVYENGGIYLDTDVELLKNLDFLREYDFYIGVQQQDHLCTTGLGFGAAKSDSMVLEMLEQYDGLVYLEKNKDELACPLLNNKVLENAGYRYTEEKVVMGKVLILPPKYLDPVAPGDENRILRCEDTISIHHYSASWMGRKTALRRKIIRKIGQERISRFKRILGK